MDPVIKDLKVLLDIVKVSLGLHEDPALPGEGAGEGEGEVVGVGEGEGEGER